MGASKSLKKCKTIIIEINIKNDLEVEGYLRIQTEALNNYAYPRIIRTFLDDNFNDKKKKEKIKKFNPFSFSYKGLINKPQKK